MTGWKIDVRSESSARELDGDLLFNTVTNPIDNETSKQESDTLSSFEEVAPSSQEVSDDLLNFDEE